MTCPIRGKPKFANIQGQNDGILNQHITWKVNNIIVTLQRVIENSNITGE
jgi:hypothetical protein